MHDTRVSVTPCPAPWGVGLFEVAAFVAGRPGASPIRCVSTDRAAGVRATSQLLFAALDAEARCRAGVGSDGERSFARLAGLL